MGQAAPRASWDDAWKHVLSIQSQSRDDSMRWHWNPFCDKSFVSSLLSITDNCGRFNPNVDERVVDSIPIFRDCFWSELGCSNMSIPPEDVSRYLFSIVDSIPRCLKLSVTLAFSWCDTSGKWIVAKHFAHLANVPSSGITCFTIYYFTTRMKLLQICYKCFNNYCEIV